jgi:Calx-beta domain
MNDSQSTGRLRRGNRNSVVMSALLAVGLLALAAGCDRQDNDWGAFDPNAKRVVIETDTLQIAENGDPDSFRVSLQMVPADTVALLVTGDGGQVHVEPDTLFFPPVDDEWAAVRTIKVWATNDEIAEGPHADALTLTVVSSDAAYDGQGGAALVPVVIGDDDGAGVAISETLLTLVESMDGGLIESYQVVLLSQPTDTVSIAITCTPVEPSLHIEPNTLSFAPDVWNAPQRVTLWVELDDLDNDDLELVLGHSATSADSNYGPSLAIPSIDLLTFDATTPPVARVHFSDPGRDTLLESLPAQTVDLQIVLDRPSNADVRLHVATLDGTGSGSVDFIAVDQDVLFLPGDPLTRTLSLTVLDDAVLEWPEDFIVAITEVENVFIAAEDRLTIQIQDDDTTALSLDVTSVDEDSGAAEFVVSISQPVMVPLEFRFVTADGTAVAGEDYEAIDEAFVIEPGQTEQVIPVVLLADPDHEPDESFTGRLENLSGHATWAQGPVDCTILNDDPQAIVMTGGEFDEAAGDAVFTVHLVSPFNAPVTLTLNTLAGDGLGATSGQEDAAPTVDYNGLSSAIRTVPAGATSLEIQIPIRNDAVAEASVEYFRLEIVGADEAGFAGLIAMATIIDDDLPCLSAGDLIVDETDAAATFRVDLQNDSGQPITSQADVTFLAAPLNQTAEEGLDFTGAPQAVTILAGQGGVDVPIALLDDGHDDDNETFVLVLSDPVNAVGNCREDAPFCRIVDDEFPSVNLIALAADRYNEGSTYGFIVRLTTPRQDFTTFVLNLSPGTSDGQGVDYDFIGNGIQTIPAFQTEVSFSVPYLDDQLTGEADETVQIDISGANVALGVAQIYATIVDAPELEIAGNATSEGVPAEFLVSLDAASTAPVQFMVQYASGTATAGADFANGGTGPFTIPAGIMTTNVVVPVTAGDGGDAAVEDYFVTLITPTNATIGPFNSAVGTIADMDPPVLSWAGSAGAVEGTDIQFTVNLSWSSEVGVQFELVFTDGSAARAGIDYDDADIGPYTVPPGAVNYVVTVPTTADGLPELAVEDFTVTLVSPVDAVIGTPATTTGYVQDGDQPELTIPVGDTGIEGNDLSFTVHLSQPTIVPVFFDLEYDNGSTQGATDFDATNTGPFSMAAGTTDTTIVVVTFDDAEFENQEAFIVRLAADPVNAVLGDPYEANGVIDDDD